jgi:hypothetical protein
MELVETSTKLPEVCGKLEEVSPKLPEEGLKLAEVDANRQSRQKWVINA